MTPAIPSPKYLLKRNENMCPQKDVCVNVHSSIIHNSQKAETAQISISW